MATKGEKMNWATAHRIVNSVAIFLIAMALFTMLERLIVLVEQEYTLPQCEVLLFEKIYERDAPKMKDE